MLVGSAVNMLGRWQPPRPESLGCPWRSFEDGVYSYAKRIHESTDDGATSHLNPARRNRDLMGYGINLVCSRTDRLYIFHTGPTLLRGYARVLCIEHTPNWAPSLLATPL